MPIGQFLIILVCAGLGFGIVNSLINAARRSNGVDTRAPKDGEDP